jgi:hypothetical protein
MASLEAHPQFQPAINGVENLRAAESLFTAWYKFCRVHQTLRVTPAMEANLTDHIRTVRELLTAERGRQR